MVRAVAGRRALQVVLLLAGLLALGFLCGERAHAVDGAQAPAPVRERVAEPVREQVAEPVRETAGAGRETVRHAAVEPVADAAEPVVRSARGVVRPVVDEVTGVLEGAPQRVLPESPDIPNMPGMPSVPGTSELPRPDPGAGGGGGDDSDAGAGAGASTGVGAELQSPQGAAQHGDDQGESSYGTGIGTGTGNTYSAYNTTYPTGQQVRGAAVSGGDASGDARGTGHEPFPSAPGDPGRTLGGQSAGDGSSTRHGDPCAASLDSRAPVRLLPGGGASQVSAPIRDRHRDILEFPG